MSIYATNYIIDENGKPVLLKRLNKERVDRKTLRRPPGKWNKSGNRARISKRSNKFTKIKFERRQNKITRINDADND